MFDLAKEVLGPIISWLHSCFGTAVAIISQATWDMSDGGDVKKPISQSAALIVVDSSSQPVNWRAKI